MQTNRIIFLLITTIVFQSCFLNKKSRNKIETVNLDTLETVANAINKNEPKNYNASATRINDIIHTKLDVSFDWEKQYLYGKANITIKPYFYPTSTLELDARGMELKEISLVTDKIKTPLKFDYKNDVISIQLGKTYAKNETYEIFIDYISKPNELEKGGSFAITEDKGLYFINPMGKESNKPQQIWTQGETQSSSAWFPTIDRPNERMTQEICITVNKKYNTLSNGELAFSIDNNDTTRTDCWKMELPHAPYLAMMAIGEYAIIKDKWKGKEVNYYVEKEYESHAKAIFGNTPEMLEFYSTKLGVEYPWNKYSQVVVRDYVSGAMENTTATIHGEFLQQTDRELLDNDFEAVIAHELFHQWFGDMVTCESWSNLPLNESFATYGEYLWEEYKYGLDAADFHSAQSRHGYLGEASSKQVDLIRFDYEKQEDMFDGHSYNKGGQVLHMLRKYVGDDAFFTSLKLYLEKNKFNSVEIHNLRLAFEEITGEDLNWFFNQWFLSSGHPDLKIISEYNSVNKKQIVTISQLQDLEKSPLFKIPMCIDIYADGKVKREKIVLKKAVETFEFDAASKPNLVNVDAEKMLLCTKSENKSKEEWAFQYKNAPLYLDRIEAISELVKMSIDSITTHIILLSLNDKFWSIRKEAVSLLKEIPEGHEAEIKSALIKIATSDEKSIVRASAIYHLSANYKDEEINTICKNALNDKSYSVMGAGLSAIAKSNPEEGMKLAKNYENEKNIEILYTITELYSKHGSDKNNDFFISVQDKFTGFNKIGYLTQYLKFLKNDKNDEIINKGVSVFENIAKNESSSKWVVYYAKKSIQEIETMYTDKIVKLEDELKTKKASNPNGGGLAELETQLANAKAQAEKINSIYKSIK